MRPSKRVGPRVLVVVVLALLGGLLVAPHGSAAVLGDDYPANLKRYARDAKVDPWRFYNRECTSFVAWRINDALNFPFDDYWLVHWGNASNWKKAATSTAVKNAGVTVDDNPTVGSVAWWGAGSAGSSVGHVAWVAVASASSITIEEYNYASPGNYGTRVITRSSAKWPGAFIHFKPVTITNTAAPAISGTPKVGVALSASAGTWSVGSLTYAYQWYAGTTAITGATSSKFTPTATQLGKTIAVRVTATKSGLKAVAKKSAATPVVASGAFKVTTAPKVTGTPKVGVPLTVSAGTWSPAGAYTYQWMAGGVAIDGATGTTYTPGPADVGKPITVAVQATKAGYTTTSAKTAATVVVDKGDFVNTKVPAVVGTARVGEAVSAAPGTWTPPGTYKYQWRSGGTAIPGSTGSAYTPGPGNLGKDISVSVTVTGAGYRNATKVSKTVIVAPGRFVASAPPSLGGTPQVGQTMSVKVGTWTPSPTSTNFHWLVDGTPVPGAVARTFTPRPADLGKTVSVRVTVNRDAYTSTTSTLAGSAPVVAGVNTATRPPAVSGTTQRGKVLTVTPGTWRVSPATRHYQWYADGAAISGATGRSLTLATAQVGKRITVVETVTATGYQRAQATSVATRQVLYGAIAFRQKPSLTGSTRVGSVLTAHAGTTSPAHPALAYQWYRGSTPISGATASTYRSTDADLGSRISARITATADLWAAATTRVTTTTTIRSLPRLQVTSAMSGPRGRLLTMTIRVTAPGVTQPGGVLVVRDGRRRIARVDVVKGVAHVRASSMRKGLRHLYVAYLGTSTTQPVTVERSIRVP